MRLGLRISSLLSSSLVSGSTVVKLPDDSSWDLLSKLPSWERHPLLRAGERADLQTETYLRSYLP